MMVTVGQLANAINNCARITPESSCDGPGMGTWEIAIMNKHNHIVDRSYHTGWFQEEAERIARDRCAKLKESSWQVVRSK